MANLRRTNSLGTIQEAISVTLGPRALSNIVVVLRKINSLIISEGIGEAICTTRRSMISNQLGSLD